MTSKHQNLAHLDLTQIYGLTFSNMSLREVLPKKINSPFKRKMKTERISSS